MSRAAMQQALEALEKAMPIVQYDAQMMADITRHAPLDPESQAKHDSTEYESERLVRQIPEVIAALRAALAEQKCPCGDRQSNQCPGEWEPGCDLGANEKHAKVYEGKGPE